MIEKYSWAYETGSESPYLTSHRDKDVRSLSLAIFLNPFTCLSVRENTCFLSQGTVAFPVEKSTNEFVKLYSIKLAMFPLKV